MRPLSQRILNNARHPLRLWDWWRYQASRPAEKDVLLITLANAGTHWIRTLLSQSLVQAFSLEDRIDTIRQPDLIPTFLDKTARFKYNERGSIPRIQHSHAAWMPLFGKRRVLLVVRDLRDAIASHYRTYIRTVNPDISFSDFLRGNRNDTHLRHSLDSRIAFLNSWWDRRDSFPAFSVLRYEDMKKSPEETLKTTLSLAGIPALSSEKVAEVLAFCSVENMKKMEEAHPNPRFSVALEKIGQGKTGGYRDLFSAEDSAWFQEKVAHQLRHDFGYDYTRQ